MGVCVPEKVLHDVWRRSDATRARIATSDGQRLKILYSGMLGGSYGPDFREAILEAEDGSEVVGDVEIHGRTSEWYAHGHDSDPKYGRVMFHAVGNPDVAGSGTVNSLGMTVSEIGIQTLIGGYVGDVSSGHGAGARQVVGEGEIDRWLDEAGDERFAMKIKGCRAEIERFGADLAMQITVFECLGFPRNREAFRHLARRLPWPLLAMLSNLCGGRKTKSGDAALELLRWAAGFAEKPAWLPVPRLAGDEPRWVAAAGRPANRPEARLVAAAKLIELWLQAGGPVRHALQAISRAERGSDLMNAYKLSGGVLGAGRAGEIVVNAVLPTIAAWAEIGRDHEVYTNTMRLYREHPSLPSNSIVDEAKRVLRRRGAPIERVHGARRQQGLMHIYKSMVLRPRPARQMGFGCRVLSS